MGEHTWERRLWQGRRYLLTDLRIISTDNGVVRELALADVGDVHRSQTGAQRLIGLSTVEVRPKDARRTRVVIRDIRRGTQLAALIELLGADPRVRRDEALVATARVTMTWEPRISTPGARRALFAIACIVMATIGVVARLHGTSHGIAYPPDDAVYPNGVKKGHTEVVRFMQAVVMPWARDVLAPIAGSRDRVTCATCHGAHAETSGWQMPAVAELPRPAVRDAGWETWGGSMDAQMRNAIYGYSAESGKLTRAAYMREVVMPGMARLLHRPAYDFTRSYQYNREQFAFGCYHCHKVK